MIRVPEPDPPEVRSRPTWPTPLASGSVSGHAKNDFCHDFRAPSIRDGIDSVSSRCICALVTVSRVRKCIRSTRSKRAHRARVPKRRAAVRCHALNDLSRVRVRITHRVQSAQARFARYPDNVRTTIIDIRTTSGGGRWLSLDIRTMSGQRPDNVPRGPTRNSN